MKEKIIKDGKKNERNEYSSKTKIEDTYHVSCKRCTGNSNIESKTINNKVKLLKTKCLKCKHDKSMFFK